MLRSLKWLFRSNRAEDDAASMLWLMRPKADEGDPDAQYNLGNMYKYGWGGVVPSHIEAAKWYRLAASQGHINAQTILGQIYYNGEGVARDYTEALKWYGLAASRGDAIAQCALSTMYYHAEGVQQDYVQAHMWADIAASRFGPSDTEMRAQTLRCRDFVAAKMSSAQISDAQRLARAWKPTAAVSMTEATEPTAHSLAGGDEFKVGDWVSYPAHGIGRIQKVDEQEVGGLTLELFVIAFEKERTILRVPAMKAKAVGMRKVSSPDVAEGRPVGDNATPRPGPTVVRISAPPLAEDGTPLWTAELETAARDRAPASSNGPKTFELRFLRDGNEIAGTAIAGEYEGKHRIWQVRAVVLPAFGAWQASLHFIFPGENPELPGGGQKMRWRRPIHDREVHNLADVRDAYKRLLRVKELDVIAEEAHQEATAQADASMSKMIEALGSDDPNAFKNWSDSWLTSMQSMAGRLNRTESSRRTIPPARQFAIKRVLEGRFGGPMLEIEPPPLDSDGMPELSEELASVIEPYMRDRDNIALRFTDQGLPTTMTAVIGAVDVEHPGVAIRYSVRVMLFEVENGKTGANIHARPVLSFMKGDNGERLGVQQKISAARTYDFQEVYDDMEQASHDLERVVKLADSHFRNNSGKS